MESFFRRVLALFEAIHPLDKIARAGFVLRGVPDPESVAAHSHFVSLLTLLFVDEYPDRFDGRKALTMALIHDLCEARLMDIPMPAADRHFREAKDAAEQEATAELLAGFPDRYAIYHREMLDASSPEARLVRGLDKAQMMIKILMYEHEQKGRLTEFWSNPRNFDDFGLEPVAELFDALCAQRGVPRPR